MALRLVYDDYTSSFKDLQQKDGSVSVHHQNIHSIAIEMYKIKNKLSPKIVQTIFQQREVSNLRSEQTFLRPNINTIYNGEQSLRSFGPVVWNDLLPDIFKSATTLNKFKHMIKLWVPTGCPCRLCKDYVPGLGFV